MLRVVLVLLLIAGVVGIALKVVGVLASIAWTLIVAPFVTILGVLFLAFVYAMVRANINA